MPTLPAAAPIVAFAQAPVAFSHDQVLASGPSATWLDALRWTLPVRPLLPPIRASITRFIERD